MFEKALHYDPLFFSAMKNAGYAWERLENLEKALSYYEQALERNKADGSLYVNIATVYTKLGRFDEAKEYFLRSVKLAPRDPAGWMGLRDLSLKKGDIKTYTRSTCSILHRLEVESIAESLRVLRRLKQFEAVDTIIRQADALDLKGDLLDAERLLAYQRQGSGSAAGIIYKRLNSIARPPNPVLHCLAEYCFSTSRFDAALQPLRTMVEAEPEDHLLLWKSLSATGAGIEAEERIQRYLRDHPDYFEAWFQLARVRASRNDEAGARECLLRAMETGFNDLDQIENEPMVKRIFASITTGTP
jgi:tetratricopeptide (TPR) repeat protein